MYNDVDSFTVTFPSRYNLLYTLLSNIKECEPSCYIPIELF